MLHHEFRLYTAFSSKRGRLLPTSSFRRLETHDLPIYTHPSSHVRESPQLIHNDPHLMCKNCNEEALSNHPGNHDSLILVFLPKTDWVHSPRYHSPAESSNKCTYGRHGTTNQLSWSHNLLPICYHNNGVIPWTTEILRHNCVLDSAGLPSSGVWILDSTAQHS